MLSYIYRIANEFRRQHGYRPNVLYLSTVHLNGLKQEFANPTDMDTILRFLDMEILIEPETAHPHVAWVNSATRAVAAN